ncbi:hypothetical protein [Streptomyces sedi]|uniref:Nuclear transport factor 2 family protein n=1 Tax=Streptomyces sedi TaxID=555059 RepID=A0A5C4VCM9_9ACTN|nr:hypothetical protein [Streptomyces sedi]TNM33640.1 hypothetical protein FH715_04670 [Streptomyces sedi]
MHTLAPGASDEEILDAVFEWVRLLAVDDHAAANTFLAPHPDPRYRLTPEELRACIANYGAGEPVHGRTTRVTSPDTATGDHPTRTQIWREDGMLPRVEIALPLNGVWSDLTAILDIQEDAGRWVLTLEQVHVL